MAMHTSDVCLKFKPPCHYQIHSKSTQPQTPSRPHADVTCAHAPLDGAEDVVGDGPLDFELLSVREAAAVDDAHLLDEGRLAGLAAPQQEDPVLHLALLLLILQF